VGFDFSISSDNHMFCIHHILGREWEYSVTMYHLFIDFNKGYDSLRRKVLYNIFTVSVEPLKLVMLIKMCLNETYNKVHTYVKICLTHFLSKMTQKKVIYYCH
jgi:hypothetical protein